MIYLNPQNRSGLGEDTFWTWIKRKLGEQAAWGEPLTLLDGDFLLQYSTMGPPTCQRQVGSTAIALCWELHPEMVRQMPGHPGIDGWRKTVQLIGECARSCDRRVVASPLMVDDYSEFGPVDIMPIGVDTDLFWPYRTDRSGYFWCGTSHEMKGPEVLAKFINDNPNADVTVVWKSPRDVMAGLPSRVGQHVGVGQNELAGLMADREFLLVTGKLRPYFMAEWEAMASGLYPVYCNGLQKDHQVGDADARQSVFDAGWSRHQALGTWGGYLDVEPAV